MPSNLPPTTTKQDYYTLTGGLNLMAPALQIPPGMLIDCMNYEPEVLGGYHRLAGYERRDGRPAPSAQTYWLVECTITGAVAAGNTITGATSGATAVVLQVNAAEVVVSKLTGAFVVGENLRVGGVTQAVSTSVANQGGAATPKLDASYTSLAANLYRADIQTVPGSGRVLGVWFYNDKAYAFRANNGGTAVNMYVESAGGWTLITLGDQVSFTAGSVAPVEGALITQGANSATVSRVVLESGTWTGGNAAGRLILTGAPAPGNFTAGALTGSPVRATFVRGHQNQLCFLMGPSFQNSGIGQPYVWTALGGAAEIALGDIGTGMQIQAGNSTTASLAIWTRKKTFMLYGTSAADWQFVVFSNDVGAQPYTAQNLGVNPMYQDNRGVTVLQTVQAYGNFQSATISQFIQSLINSKSGKTTASCITRGRNQLRLFCLSGSDTTGIIIGMQGATLLGFTLFDYGRPVRCVCSLEASDGSEVILFGSDDGYVYQAEKGTSFDGGAIEAWITTAYVNDGTPRTYKQYRAAQLELASEGYGQIQHTYDLGYGDPDSPASATVSADIDPGGGKWDNAVWDDFFWDSAPVQPIQFLLEGTATNISDTFYSKSDQFSGHTLQSLLIDYALRRALR